MSDNNSKSIIAALISAFVIAAAIFLIVIPLIADIEDIRLRIRSRRFEAADYDRRIANAREFAAFSKEKENELGGAEAVFANIKMPLGLINFFENTARASNIKIEFSSSAVQDSRQGRSFLKIEMKASGNSSDVFIFIEKIENSPYLVEIESVSIEFDGTANINRSGNIWRNPVTARISLMTYAQLQSQ